MCIPRSQMCNVYTTQSGVNPTHIINEGETKGRIKQEKTVKKGVRNLNKEHEHEGKMS